MTDELRILPHASRVEEELLRRARANGGAAFGLGLTTFGELERSLLASAGLAPIERTTAELLATEVVTERSERSYGRSWLALYDRLRDGGASLQELERATVRLSGLSKRRAERLATWARSYQAKLDRLHLHDEAAARRELLRRLPSMRLPEVLVRIQAVVVEDILDLPPTRVQLLEGLVRRGYRVVLLLPEVDGRPALLPALEGLERTLSEHAPSVETQSKRHGTGAGRAFAADLFTESCRSSTVRLIEADRPEAELRAILGALRQRLDAGVAPDDIAIAVRDLPSFREELTQSLDRAGIPWHERRGLPALAAPPCAIALAVIDLALSDLGREPLAALLTSRYVDGDAAAGRSGQPFLSARQVVEWLWRAGSRDQRGAGHLGRLCALRQRLDDPAEQLRAERAIAHLKELLPALQLPRSGSIRAHCAALERALIQLRLPDRCRAREERSDEPFPEIDAAAAAALARDQAALRALAAAFEALQIAARQLDRADTSLELSHFREQFAATLTAMTLPTRGARGGAVRLLEASELVGSTIPHLILAGVSIARFPLPQATDPLFDESDRTALQRVLGRTLFRSRANEEPLLFMLACAAAQESLLLTTSSSDRRGHERVASPFFLAACQALGNPTPERVAVTIIPSVTIASTPTELMMRAAQLASGGAPDATEPAGLRAAVERRFGPRLAAARERAQRFHATHPTIDPPLSLGAPLSALAALLQKEPAPTGAVWTTSATAIESYAACPFRFFAQRLLKLPESRTPRDELDPLEAGDLYHTVARNAFTALAVAGLLPLRGGAQAAVERATALAACEQTLAEWAKRTGPEGFWALQGDQARAVLWRLLESELRDQPVEVPTDFEAPFGFGDVPPLYLPSPDSTEAIAVRGRIDRIDRLGERAVVIDYKSGRVAERMGAPEIGRTELQLPLYAAWVRAQSGAVQVDAAFRSLRNGELSSKLAATYERHGGALADLLELDPDHRCAARQGAPVEPAAGAKALPEAGYPSIADTVWALFRALRSGRFPVRPSDPISTCAQCGLATVCRIDRRSEAE